MNIPNPILAAAFPLLFVSCAGSNRETIDQSGFTEPGRPGGPRIDTDQWGLLSSRAEFFETEEGASHDFSLNELALWDRERTNEYFDRDCP